MMCIGGKDNYEDASCSEKDGTIYTDTSKTTELVNQGLTIIISSQTCRMMHVLISVSPLNGVAYIQTGRLNLLHGRAVTGSVPLVFERSSRHSASNYIVQHNFVNGTWKMSYCNLEKRNEDNIQSVTVVK